MQKTEDARTGRSTTFFSLVMTLLLMAPSLAFSQPSEWLYAVRPGDNLWGLSKRYLVDTSYVKQLQALNKVQNPDLLQPGSRLRIPISWLKIQPVPVHIKAVQGDVTAVFPQKGLSAPLISGAKLHIGDEIHTGKNSSATLEFADGSHLLLQSESILLLDTMSAYRKTGMVDTRLRLKQGRADSVVIPARGPASRYQIETPAAVTAVRGTDFRVGSSAGAVPVLRAEVLGGEVGVSGSGKTQSVKSGYGVVVEAGSPPTPPVKLLPPPDIAELPARLERLPARFDWPPMAGAVAYRTQLAPSKEFRSLLLDMTSTQPLFRYAEMADGHYFLRLRGIDEKGLEGLDAIHPFELNAFPEPPFPVQPGEGQTVRTEQPVFQWSVPSGAVSYRFQLADDEAFGHLLMDQEGLKGSQITPEPAIEPGYYYWRIATIDQQGEQGPYSDIRGFRLRPEPPPPDVEAPEASETELQFQWREAAPGQQFQVQVAHDPQLDRIHLDERLTEAMIKVERPSTAPVCLRIRTIDVDGYEGPFSSVQCIEPPPAPLWPWLILALPALL